MAGLLLASAALTVSAGEASNVSVAERFVDAFYSFDPEPLGDLLDSAGDSKGDILFYQGWAQDGNYIVMQRMPCEPAGENSVRCSITVQDDLVLALGIDFDVTDTFDIAFSGGTISAVETSSNDPELYHDARDWVWEHRSEWVQGPCRGSDDVAPDPGQCVTNMLKGYRDYANEKGLMPRKGK